MNRLLTIFRSYDWVLFGLVVLFVAVSLVMLYSLSLNVDAPDLKTFREQVIFVVIGFLIFFVVSTIDYRTLRGFSLPLFAFGAMLLLAVLLFGSTIRGTKSWFVIGPWTFQPVEFAKIFLVLFFAKYLSDHPGDLLRLRHLFICGAGVGLYLLLTFLQPDPGSSLILLGLFFGITLLVNVRRSHLLLLLVVLVIGAALSWFFVLRDYHRERILLVFDPARDPLGRGYNVQQAKIAIGAGRMFGRGLGLGSQSQLNFLPEQKTDFIFAAIAEELGFVGAALLITLFGLLFHRLARIARRCRDDFGLYLVFGIFIVLFLQMVMNIGTNLGLFPVAGVPLPLISAGGSSLITTMIALGIVESVAIQQNRLRVAPRR